MQRNIRRRFGVVLSFLFYAATARAEPEQAPPTYVVRGTLESACRTPEREDKEATQTEIKDFEMTRNGGFDYGLSGWLIRQSGGDIPAGTTQDTKAEVSSSAAYISAQTRQSTHAAQIDGLGLELRLERDVLREKVVSQSLDTPIDLSGLRVRFKYRISATYPGGALQDTKNAEGQEVNGLKVSIQRVRSQQALWSRDFSADLTQTVEATPLEEGWFQFDASINDTSALASMSASSVTADSGPLLVRFSMAGQGMLLQLDDISVQAAGSIRWPDSPGRIAYAIERPGRAPGYALRCITPDGQTQSEFFLAVGYLGGLRWRPADDSDAEEFSEGLALMSSHDPALSNWEGDFYLLDDDDGLVRLTHPHVLSDDESYVSENQPKGKVRGQIQNPEPYYQTVQVHVQGAQFPAMMTLRPGETAAFSLDAVVDLDEPQFVVVRTRDTAFEAPWRIDVQAGSVVDLPEILTLNRAYTTHNPGQPTWDRTGKKLVFAGERNQLLVVDPGYSPVPLGITGRDPRFSPVDDRLLYVATDPLQPDRERVWLWDSSDPSSPPIPLVQSSPTMPQISSPTWLPDGAGFLYIALGCPADEMHCTSELHSFRFDGTNNKRVALFPDEEIRSLTLSPDGRFAAFVRTMVWSGFRPKHRSALSIVSLERPTMRWRMADGDNPSFPDWSLY